MCRLVGKMPQMAVTALVSLVLGCARGIRCFFPAIYLSFVTYLHYSLEKWHRTWKSPCWKGKSSSKPPFFGFHVSFQGCNRKLGGGFKQCLYIYTSTWGNDLILTILFFQMGWLTKPPPSRKLFCGGRGRQVVRFQWRQNLTFRPGISCLLCGYQ